jgi:hypothetical protein
LSPLTAAEYPLAYRAWQEVSAAAQRFHGSADTAGLRELSQLRDVLAAAVSEYERDADTGLRRRFRRRWRRLRERRRTVTLSRALAGYGVEFEAPAPDAEPE